MLCLAQDTRVSLILIKIVHKGTKQPSHKTYTIAVPPRDKLSVKGEMLGHSGAAIGKRAGEMEEPVVNVFCLNYMECAKHCGFIAAMSCP